MKRSSCVLILAILLAAPSALATCDEPARRGFDFWLGEWEIGQKFRAGNDEWVEHPAATVVAEVLEGCAILERWRGVVQYPWAGMERGELMEGLSIRYYIPEEKVWRILWMDSRNPMFSDGMFGTIENGYGEFEPKDKPASGQWARIVFDQKASDFVDWHLDLTTDGGETWRTIWIMEMTRKSEE